LYSFFQQTHIIGLISGSVVDDDSSSSQLRHGLQRTGRQLYEVSFYYEYTGNLYWDGMVGSPYDDGVGRDL